MQFRASRAENRKCAGPRGQVAQGDDALALYNRRERRMITLMAQALQLRKRVSSVRGAHSAKSASFASPLLPLRTAAGLLGSSAGSWNGGCAILEYNLLGDYGILQSVYGNFRKQGTLI